MRVISGLKKGHKLIAPKGLDVRPTEDKIKESLFNIIGNINSDSLILDLFAGTGSIGIEFLSRGATGCYFVDISAVSLSAVKDNLIHTGFLDSGIITKKDATKAIIEFNKNGIKYDYIYVDPPFRHEYLLKNILELISNNSILSPNGTIIIEHEKELILEDDLYGFVKYKNRNYGSKTLDFYKNIQELGGII